MKASYVVDGRYVRSSFNESGTLGFVSKAGGKFLLKLNIDSSPIAYKYHEGKVKRTLKRELKVSEIAGREAIETRVPLLGLLSIRGSLDHVCV